MVEKKNTWSVVSIIILSLLVVGLGGFIVYDNYFRDKDVANNNTKGTTNNSYKTFAKNLKSQFSKYDSNNKNYQYINNHFVEDGYEVYLNKNGNLYVRYFNENLNSKYGTYKIAEDVLSFYAINVGQDVGNMIFFINEDGTVGSADTEFGIDTDNKITITRDLGHENIVSITNDTFGDGNTGVYRHIFIDINGNIFSENLD